VRYTSGASPTTYRYTGQREEASFGLYYYNARWYDPALGRFAQADSIVPEVSQGVQAWDRYAYVNNNPIINTDPSGHFCVGPLLAVCAAVLTFIVVNKAAISAVTITIAIMSFVGPSNPDPQLINDPVASQQAFENSMFQAGGVLSLGNMALQLGETYGPKSYNGPDYIVTRDGVVIPVPDDAIGPFPTKNEAGIQFIGGNGGNGLNNNVSNVRIMDPTVPKPPSPGYPNGYVVYSNSSGQTINPVSGQTVSPSNPFWHIEIKMK